MKKKEEVFIKVEQEYENCVKKSDEKMRELKVATEHADAAEADTDVAKHELFKSNQDRDHLRGSDEAILMTELEEKLKSTMAEIEARQDKGKIGELRGRLAVAKGSLDDTRGSLEKMQAELAKLQTETVPGLQQRLEQAQQYTEQLRGPRGLAKAREIESELSQRVVNAGATPVMLDRTPKAAAAGAADLVQEVAGFQPGRADLGIWRQNTENRER